MTSKNNSVLAIYIARGGVAFVHSTEDRVVLDWAINGIKGKQKHAHALQKARTLIKELHPGTVIVEAQGARRTEEIWKTYTSIAQYAKQNGASVYRYARQDIQDIFKPLGATNKHMTNIIVATIYPALRFRMPRERKTWDAELHYQALFDAATLAVLYLVHQCGFKIPPVPETK